MNIITKHPVNNLGYNFIDPEYLPEGEDEYYIRNKQNNNGINYRKLSALKKKYLYGTVIILMTGIKFLFPMHLILHR